ncbi:MAG: Crp/Fnr family transcriptional regulator [Syntrophales bacterium]|nr:Crp/Fnr family transcriptional regulator [Syntrophales bacterium]
MPVPEALIKMVPLFKGLTTDDCRKVAAVLQVKTIKKGDLLFRRGDEGNSLFIINGGTIKVSRKAESGDEIILATLTRGDFLGEMALLDGKPRSADAVALDTTQVYILNRDDFITFVMNNKTAMRSILAALAHRLRRTDDFLEDSVFLSISERLAKKLLELADQIGLVADGMEVTIPISQSQLSAFIGARRESVTKILKDWRNKGILATTSNKIIIKNIDAIRKKIKVLPS